jgi:outer membrane protein assembly factor BamB
VSDRLLDVAQTVETQHLDASTGERRGTSTSGGGVYSQYNGMTLVAKMNECNCRVELAAEEMTTGKTVWTSQVELSSPEGPPVVVVVTERGIGFVRGADGRLHGVSLRNGAVQWSASPGKSIPASWNTPAVAGGLLYTVGGDGALHALDVTSGRESWAFHSGAPGGVSIPAIANRQLHVAGRDALYVLEPATGRLQGSVSLTGGFVLGPPIVTSGTVFLQVLAAEGAKPGAEYLYAVDAASRAIKGRFLLEPSIGNVKVLTAEWGATLAEQAGTVFVGSTGKQVFALRSDGPFEAVPQDVVGQTSRTSPRTTGVQVDSGAPPSGRPVSRNYEIVFNDDSGKVVGARGDGSGRRVLAQAGRVRPESCSPTGRYLALDDGSGLSIVEVSTGRRVPVDTTPTRGFRWTSGSDKLLVGSEARNPNSAATPQRTLFEVDAASRQSRRLADVHGLGTVEGLSPDGRRLLFNSDDGTGRDLYVADLDGGNKTRLTHSGDVIGFAWSPRGDSIVYYTGWLPRQPPQPTTTEAERVAEYTRMVTRELFVVRPDGSGAKALGVTVSLGGVPISWHPDGRSLLLLTQLIRPDECRPALPAAPQSPVTCAGTMEVNPRSVDIARFTPSGEELVFATALQSGRYSVSALDLERGTRVIVGEGPGAESPSFSVCRASIR